MKYFKTGSKFIITSAVIIFGLFLYFFKLDKIPSGFYIDEALPGYNAYSILKTGKDEYGKILPILFQFYGSYNPPLYTYLTITPVALMGLNIFSVRFVSALAGLLSVIPYYLLLKSSKILKNKSAFFLSVLLFIIQPWIIFHSRIGYEVSLAFLIYSFGLYLLWLGLENKGCIVFGLALLSLSIHAAYTQRYLVPLVIIGFIILFKNKLAKLKAEKDIKKGLLSAVIIQLPLIFLITTPAFFPKTDLLSSSEIVSQADKIPLPHILSSILAFLREFLSQYATYFSPRSLFFLSDPDTQRSVPELSVFYFWMIVPFFAGLYSLWKNRNKNFSKLIILLAILSPIPAALTHNPFATHRALPHYLPLMLIAAFGVDTIIGANAKRIWIPVFSFLFCFSLLLLWRSYFVFLPKERAKVWGYGVDQISEEIAKRPDINFVIDQSRIKPTYINLAFFLNYPPEKYQAEGDQSIKQNYYGKANHISDRVFGNIKNRNISWGDDIYKKQILVGDEFAISEGQVKEHFLEKVFEIRSPIDEILFVGYETFPDKKCESNPDNINCENPI